MVKVTISLKIQNDKIQNHKGHQEGTKGHKDIFPLCNSVHSFVTFVVWISNLLKKQKAFRVGEGYCYLYAGLVRN